MRKRNQFILFLSLLLILVGLPGPSHAANFKDIRGHWGEKNIIWAEKEGYITGYPDGTFKPNAPINRAEYYRITNQFIKKNTDKISSEPLDTTAEIGYADVKSSDWFFKEVQIGIQAGYISEADESEVLNPKEAIPREEAIWIFAKNQDWAENLEATNKMVDHDDIGDKYKGLVGAAIENKVIHGNKKSEFMPKKSLTRAEVATMIAQFLYPDGVPGPDPSPDPGPQGAWYWSFNNSNPNFTQGYRVNGELLDEYSKYFTSSDASTIRQRMRQRWGGSCYGMAATAGLYKEGRLKVANLNTPSKGSIEEIEPQGNYKAQSLINIFQLSQYAKSVKNSEKIYATGWNYPWVNNNTNNLKSYANSVKKVIDQAKADNSTVQLAYFWMDSGNTLGHANTIYDYEESSGKLILKVYDPNYPGLGNKEVVIDTNNGTMRAVSGSNANSGGGAINIRISFVMPTKKIMEGVKSVPSLGDKVRVLIGGDQTVTIRSGNESWTLSPDKGQVGIDSNTYTYYIPKRDSYIVDGQGSLSITIEGADYSVGFDTDGFAKGLITPRSVNLEGQKGNYFLNVAKDQMNKNFKWEGMEISGKDSRRVALTKEDFGFTLRGDQIYGSKVTGLDKFKEDNKTFKGKEKMVQIRQDGSNMKLVPNKYGDYDINPDIEDELVGSWIGQDSYHVQGRGSYDTEATLFISKNSNGTYRVVKRVEVPALGSSYVLEYNNINFNRTTRELELRANKCRVVEGKRTIRGANVGPVLQNGQLITNYGNNRMAQYTRF